MTCPDTPSQVYKSNPILTFENMHVIDTSSLPSLYVKSHINLRKHDMSYSGGSRNLIESGHKNYRKTLLSSCGS